MLCRRVNLSDPLGWTHLPALLRGQRSAVTQPLPPCSAGTALTGIMFRHALRRTDSVSPGRDAGVRTLSTFRSHRDLKTALLPVGLKFRGDYAILSVSLKRVFAVLATCRRRWCQPCAEGHRPMLEAT